MKSKWSEIRNSHIELDKDGFTIITIDGYETEDENECGKVIAFVIGKGNSATTLYVDNFAIVDEYAQNIINESLREITIGYWVKKEKKTLLFSNITVDI